MGFTTSLDEYSTNTLLLEINLRIKRANNGRCTYCNRPISKAPECKMGPRHNGIDNDQLRRIGHIDEAK